jgi:hypothetical protein
VFGANYGFVKGAFQTWRHRTDDAAACAYQVSWRGLQRAGGEPSIPFYLINTAKNTQRSWLLIGAFNKANEWFWEKTSYEIIKHIAKAAEGDILLFYAKNNFTSVFGTLFSTQINANNIQSMWDLRSTCYLRHTGFSLGLLFDPMDGGDMLHRNVGWINKIHGISQKTEIFNIQDLGISRHTNPTFAPGGV